MLVSVSNLERTWASIDELCSTLDEAAWKRPTSLPAWSVQDNIAHLIDYESRALGRPVPDVVPASLDHTRNDLGRANEVGVEARRAHAGADVLAEYREVVAARSAELEALTEEDLVRPMDTPAGPGTLGTMLTLRVMDTWTHEQDIRHALDRPGHTDGPVIDQVVDHYASLLPYVVGKRAGAPDGTVVTFAIDGRDTLVVAVEGRRAALVDGRVASATATVHVDLLSFVALVAGRRWDPRPTPTLSGDADLGARVVEHMGVMI